MDGWKYKEQIDISMLNHLSKIYYSEDQPPWESIERGITDPFHMHTFIAQTGGEISFSNPLLRSAGETSHRVLGLNPCATQRFLE